MHRWKDRNLYIESRRIYLRPLTIADTTDEYVDGLNNSKVNRFLVEAKRQKHNRESVYSFIEANQSDPNALLLGIFIKNHPQPFIGTIRISGISDYHFCGNIGICFFRVAIWGRGYGGEAIEAAKRMAFQKMGLRYLEAGVYQQNIGSIKAFRNGGFKESHRVENKYRIDDTFDSVIFLYAINPAFELKRALI
jgi:RimJ/RimL family protein N-acetyltransferase